MIPSEITFGPLEGSTYMAMLVDNLVASAPSPLTVSLDEPDVSLEEGHKITLRCYKAWGARPVTYRMAELVYETDGSKRVRRIRLINERLNRDEGWLDAMEGTFRTGCANFTPISAAA